MDLFGGNPDPYLFQGRHVHLSFITFELEEEQDCGYDFIEVRFYIQK